MAKFIPLVLFIVLGGFLYVGLSLDSKKLPSPLIGKPFPDLQVESFKDGTTYSIKDKLQGKMSLVNVWASWCVTCRAEHQMLRQIATTKRLQMIGINYKDTKKDGQRFLDILGDPFDLIIFDYLGKLGLELGVYATPESFLINKNGIIIFKHIGELTPKIWQKQLLPLLNT